MKRTDTVLPETRDQTVTRLRGELDKLLKQADDERRNEMLTRANELARVYPTKELLAEFRNLVTAKIVEMATSDAIDDE